MKPRKNSEISYYKGYQLRKSLETGRCTIYVQKASAQSWIIEYEIVKACATYDKAIDVIDKGKV